MGAECHSCRLISHKLHAARWTTSTKKPSGQVSLRKELLQLKCVNIIDPAEKNTFLDYHSRPRLLGYLSQKHTLVTGMLKAIHAAKKQL